MMKEASELNLETTKHVSGKAMDMNDRGVQTRRFAFIGMLGGFICSIADYLLEYIGALPNQTVGAYGVIETAWAEMAAWRFPASIWIAAFTVPMYVLGFIAILRQMRSTHERLGKLFGASALLGSLGGLFIHIMLCVLPVTYKYIVANASAELAVGTVDAMVSSFIVPFYTYYVFLIIIPLIVWCIYCFKKGSLYRPAVAISVVGFTIGCIALGGVVPTLSFLQVGAVSRMIGLWCMTALLTQRALLVYRLERIIINPHPHIIHVSKAAKANATARCSGKPSFPWILSRLNRQVHACRCANMAFAAEPDCLCNLMIYGGTHWHPQKAHRHKIKYTASNRRPVGCLPASIE